MVVVVVVVVVIVDVGGGEIFFACGGRWKTLVGTQREPDPDRPGWRRAAVTVTQRREGILDPTRADTGRLGRRRERESRDEQEKRMRARLGWLLARRDWRLGWRSRGQRGLTRPDGVRRVAMDAEGVEVVVLARE